MRRDRSRRTIATDATASVSARDHDVFAELVREHQEAAFRTAYIFTGSAADAEDAAQEGFVKAYLALDRYDPARPFRPWLLQIVANEARNRRRSAGRRTVHELRSAHLPTPPQSDDPEHAAELAETRSRLVALLDDLPDRERIVIALRYFAQLTEEETAAAIGVPRGTVKSRASRALRRLRRRLGDAE